MPEPAVPTWPRLLIELAAVLLFVVSFACLMEGLGR